MAVDLLDISELIEIREAESRAAAVRTRIFLILAGSGLVLFGLRGCEQPAASSPPLAEVISLLSLVILPPLLLLLLAFFQLINRRLSTRRLRCPVCHARLTAFTPAWRRCPECHATIIFDRRKLIPGYVLPPLDTNAHSLPGQTPFSVGMLVQRVLAVLFIVLALLAAKEFLMQNETLDVVVLSARLIVVLGFALLLVAGFLILLQPRLVQLAAWLDRRCDKLNCRLSSSYRSAFPAPEHLCPYCGREPDHALAAVTGNCSFCGAPLLELPPEPDSPAMMDWAKLHRYGKLRNLDVGETLFLLLLCFLFLCRSETAPVTATIVLAVLAGLWFFGLLPLLRRRWKLYSRCPGCRYQNGPSDNPAAWRFLLLTGHCAGCRRKLVRDDDPAQGSRL